MNPDRLRAEIQRTREGNDDAAHHAERVAFLRKTIAQKTAALERATMQWSEAEDDDDRATFGTARETLKRELRSLRTDLEQLEAHEPAGISEDEEAALLAFAEQTREDLDLAGPSLRQSILRHLRIRGLVRSAPETGAYRIGKHRFEIEWSGLIDLSSVPGNNVGKLVNFEELGKEIARPPMLQAGGYVPLPTTPGLGLDLDEDALRAHAYERFPARGIRQYADEP